MRCSGPVTSLPGWWKGCPEPSKACIINLTNWLSPMRNARIRRLGGNAGSPRKSSGFGQAARARWWLVFGLGMASKTAEVVAIHRQGGTSANVSFFALGAAPYLSLS